MAEGLLPLSNTTCGVRWLCVVEIANGILKSLRNKPPSSCSHFFFFIDLLWFFVRQGCKLSIWSGENRTWYHRRDQAQGQWSAGSTTILLTHGSDLIYTL